jgi:bla regulator protein BlaR1
MSLLNQLGSPALLRAVGLALLHSLWQGAGLVLVVVLLLRGLRQRAAVVRYRLAAIALLTLVGLAAATFGYYYQAPPAPVAAAPLAPATVAAAVATARAASLGKPLPVLAMPWPTLLQHYAEQYLPGLVAAWLLGVLAMTGRLLLALGYVRRLRHHRVQPAPLAWQHRLNQLATRAGLAWPVSLRVSALVPSPVVLGYFKPLILLPASVLSGLAPAELEMILAHELAHIVRRDYLFHFLQSVAETVFFYHPAVWYLSAVLHTERENCCDDLATQLTGSPQQLARALAALAELTQPTASCPHLALAAAGPAGSLLGRVRRLAHYRPAKATGFWPASLVLLAVGLLLGAALLVQPRGQALTTTRTRRALTRKNTPDEAPRTAQAPLAKSDDELQALLQAQLLADGLLPDAEHYTISLSAAGLLVNGQSQPARFLAKYQRLYETATGYRWLATTSYHTENDITYQVAPAAKGPARAAAGSAPPTVALLHQLQHDGLVPTGTQRYRLAVTKTGTFLVNGNPQPAQRLATYRPWLPLPVRRAGQTTAIEVAVR